MSTSDALFDKVVAGEMTSREAADEVMRRREWRPPNKPAWMPRGLYVAVVIILAVAFAPIIFTSNRRS